MSALADPTTASLGLAVAAGMLAAVNPCGFALLPAYLSFLILGDENPSRARAVGRALTLTGAMTLGFTGVFVLFGLVILPVAASIQQYLPWFTIVLGLALVSLGGWLLAGREIPAIRLPGRSGGKPITGSIPSMIGFGASYALASLGCTIGPFLSIVGGSLSAGIGLFFAYAFGMGLLVGLVAVATALARQGIVGRLRRIGAVLPRIAGGLLVLVGLYVAYYGWYELRSYTGADVGGDPIVGVGKQIQAWLNGLVTWLT